MRMDNEKVNKLKLPMIQYLLILLGVIVAPILGRGLAPLFDWCSLTWSGPAELRGLFAELFTVFFWVTGSLVWRFVVKRKKAATLEIQEEVSELEQEVALADATPLQGKKKETEILPLKNVGILFLITIACLALVTLQIGFHVKPFYDLGEKMTFSKLVNKGGELGQNVFRCMLIYLALKTAFTLCEGFFEGAELDEKKKTLFVWLATDGLALLIGIGDVLISGHSLAWTYLVFYVAFTAIFYFTKKNFSKSYFLFLFIYIF